MFTHRRNGTSESSEQLAEAGELRLQQARSSQPDLPEELLTSRGRLAVAATVVANTLVFGLWQYDRRHGGDVGVPSRLSRALRGHGLCSLEHLRIGRVHTLLTSSLSHWHLLHFGVNTYGIALFGGIVAERLTAVETAGVMATSSVGASLLHVLCHPRTPVLGASGALMGILSVGAMLQPDRRFRMLLPVPGLELTMLQVADVALAVNLSGALLVLASRGSSNWRLGSRLGTVAWAAHLGGTAAGLGFGGVALLRGDKRFVDPLSLHEEHLVTDWQHTAKSVEDALERAAAARTQGPAQKE